MWKKVNIHKVEKMMTERWPDGSFDYFHDLPSGNGNQYGLSEFYYDSYAVVEMEDKKMNEAGKDMNVATRWHKVADGDLPKEKGVYLVAIQDNGLAIAYFNGQYWETKFNLGDFGHCLETVIAWCEIPKCMEE